MEGQRGAALARDSGSGARMAATRGLRDQTAGDARRTRGRRVLKTVGHCSCVSVNPNEPDSVTSSRWHG